MDYDYIKIKDYDSQIESGDEGNIKYILSFNERQHLKVSEKAKKIIECFDGKNTLEDVVSQLQKHQIDINKEMLIEFVDKMLIANSVLEGMSYDSKKKGNSYMWCYLPIIQSNKLSPFFNILKIFYNKVIFGFVMAFIFTSLGISIYEFFQLKSPTHLSNSLLFILLSYLSLVLHEFGHISAAYSKGIRVGYIGIGIYLFNPVLYVDMTNSWRLNNKERILLDIGGMYFQLITLIPITAIALCTNNSFLYVINISIFIMTLFNLIPFIKLDGYWILCDYLNLSNVSTNAFHIVWDYIKCKIGVKKYTKDMGNKKHKTYLYFSFIYLLSTALMIFFGISLTLKILLDFDSVILRFGDIIQKTKNYEFGYAISQLNSVFIYILPVVFIALNFVKIIIGVIKGIFKQGGRNDKIIKCE